MELTIDYKEQTFEAKCQEFGMRFPVIFLNILDLCEYQKQNPPNSSKSLLPSFDFQMKGICRISLFPKEQENSEIDILKQNNHSFLVQKQGNNEKIYELMVLMFKKDSFALNNLLILVALNKINKDLVFFANPEIVFFEKNEFHLPFKEPMHYFAVLSEWEERVSFNKYFISLSKNKNTNFIQKTIYEFCIVIQGFLEKGFVFNEVKLDDFVILLKTEKICLNNSEHLFVFNLENTLLEINQEKYEMFLSSFKLAKIENESQIRDYVYFSLIFELFEIHYGEEFTKMRIDEFLKYYEELEKNGNAIFSFFNKNKNQKIEYPKEKIEFESSKSFKEHMFFSKVFPNNFNFCSKNDHIFLSCSLEYLKLLRLFNKFPESILLIKNLQTLEIDLLSKFEIIEQTSLMHLFNEENEKGQEILNKWIKEVQNQCNTMINEMLCKLYYLKSLFQIQKNRFNDAIKTLELTEIHLKYKKKSTLFFETVYALGHLYKETNKNSQSFRCFKKLKTFILENIPQESLIRRIYCETLAMLYIQNHEYSPAINLLEQALEIYYFRRENVDKNEKYSNILNSLGMCYFELKNAKQALIYYEKSIEIKGNLFSQNYENKGETLNNLAIIYGELGNNKKAIEMNLKAIDIYTQNKENISLANSYNNLGISYKNSGEYEKAIAVLSQALAIFEEEHGKTDLQIGKTLNNIGMTYYDKGEIEKAIEFCERALEIYKLFPDENPQAMGRTYNNLGILHSANNDFEKALISYENALKIKNRGEYKNEIDVSYTINNLAHIYNKLNKHNEALIHFKKVLEIRMKYFGATHQSTLETISNLANSNFEICNFNQAFIFFTKLLQTYQANSQNNTQEYLEILEKVGICERRLGLCEKSEEHFKEAIEILKKMPENQQYMGFLLKNLGLSLIETRKYGESLTKLKESLVLLKKFLKKNDPEILFLKEEIVKIKNLIKNKNI